MNVERNKERINLMLHAWLRDGNGTNSDEDALDLGGDTARCCVVMESDEADLGEQPRQRRTRATGRRQRGGEVDTDMDAPVACAWYRSLATNADAGGDLLLAEKADQESGRVDARGRAVTALTRKTKQGRRRQVQAGKRPGRREYKMRTESSHGGTEAQGRGSAGGRGGGRRADPSEEAELARQFMAVVVIFLEEKECSEEVLRVAAGRKRRRRARV
jgi:hypothetical protein